MFETVMSMTGLVQIAGATIILAVGAQCVLMAWGTWRRNAAVRRQRELSLILLGEQVAAAVARRETARRQSEAGWSGFRKFEVDRRVDEGGDVCSFYLKPHDRKALVPYLPGQYLTFQFRIPGQDKPVVRCYSLSDCFRSDHYRISVKKIPPPREPPGLPPGLVSHHLHHTVREGDIIDVKAPAGQFVLDPREPDAVVLIGGGVGITPVLSMLNAIADCGSTREAWLFYGVRHGGEHILREHLRRLDQEFENIHVRVCYSDVRPEDREGHDYDVGERVSVELFKRLLPSNNYGFFICGPPPMMNSLTDGLKQWGVPEDRIHFEAFGPASVKPAKARATATTAPVPGAAQTQVTFAKTGKTLSWDGASESLLAFAESNGITMESGCRAGNCGSCLVAVKSGSVRYLQQPGAAVEPGSCLTCVSVPEGDLTIEG